MVVDEVVDVPGWLGELEVESDGAAFLGNVNGLHRRGLQWQIVSINE
jgi:hypothetical protein